MKQIIYQVDSFAEKPFKGNPAAVCIVQKEASVEWMQNVAREMNLSETAFINQRVDGYAIRYFTPTTEVELCGHATLASAHILWQEGFCSEADPIEFWAGNEKLTARKNREWIEMAFPSKAVTAIEESEALLEALGVADANFIGKNDEVHLVEVDSEAIIFKLAPDFIKLSKVTRYGAIVTSKASSQSAYDCVSRCFFPNLGINEDPATGVAHCAIGPYWMSKLAKSQILALQASARSGILRVAMNADKVILGGRAVTVMRSELFFPDS